MALIRTGYGRRRHDLPEETTGIPGLAPDCLPWIYDRSLAAIGTDTGTDPSRDRRRAEHVADGVAGPRGLPGRHGDVDHRRVRP